MAETRTDKKEVVVQGRDLHQPTRPVTPAADPAYNPAVPQTRQTPIDNAPDGKPLKVIYHPGPGEPRTVDAYGATFKAGEAKEIDPKFRQKAAGNPYFELEGQKSYGDDQRKQTKQAEVEDEGDNLTFDENVVANRMEEYGTSDPVAAEQMRREGETNFARVGAPRQRGRPPKDQARAEAKARAEEQAAELSDIKSEQNDEANAEAERQARINAARAEEARKK